MSSIITAVFKATIGLLVNKGRDTAAQKLKEGDPIDQKVRELIVREMHDVKGKLDGLARKDVFAAIDFFEEGLLFLYDKVYMGSSPLEIAGDVKTVSLSKRVRNFELSGLDESATRALFKAKKRFECSREKATEAFNDEALKTSDRILAMRYRVMATILESVDNPVDVLPACRLCIEKLHSLSAVQESFTVDLKKGVRGWFSKEERREVISAVCILNRAIYDVIFVIHGFGNKELSSILQNWPCVDIKGEQVNPLLDARVAKTLGKLGMKGCCVRWSFGQEGKEEHKLKNPQGITTNTHGQFIIADNGDKTLKVFDSNGNFHLCFNLQTDDADTKLHIIDVATDVENSTYVLVRLEKTGPEMLVYNDTADLLHKFPVRRVAWGRLTVSGSKVLVLSGDEVDVYEQSGKFLCTFGKGKIKASDITAANDGRVMVMDWGDSSVHLFTVEGQHLNKFIINIEGDRYYRIACHPAGEHVVVAGVTAGVKRGTRCLSVAIFTTSGELVRRIQLDEERVWIGIRGMAVTMEGQIAVFFLYSDDDYNSYNYEDLKHLYDHDDPIFKVSLKKTK